MVEVLYCRHAYLYKKWECIACGYIYDEELGEENYYHLFDDIRDDWCCPDCGASKEIFVEMK